jgi:hypothetical protein
VRSIVRDRPGAPARLEQHRGGDGSSGLVELIGSGANHGVPVKTVLVVRLYLKESPREGAWVLLVEMGNSLGSSEFQHNGIGVMGCQE